MCSSDLVSASQAPTPANPVRAPLAQKASPRSGATNSIVTAIARAEGVEDCLFAIDACDWSDAYKDKVYQMVYRVTSDRVTSGCVVQFHINGYHTAEVLDKALDNWINVKGLRPVTVGELMQLSGRDFPPLPDYD